MVMTGQTSTSTYIRSGLKKLASPSMVFFVLPWLMVLLAAGTIAQKEMGIYAAQNTFFSSWIFWFGPFPLPGGYLTVGFLTLCLLAKFLMYSPWSIARAGTILSHLGILILLIGGILTAFTQKEGFIILKEGAEGNRILDYHQRVLQIEKNDVPVLSVPFEKLEKGKSADTGNLPFHLTIEDTCRNCRAAALKDSANRRGLAAQAQLMEAPPEKENELNLSGATLRINDADTHNGIYIVMEDIGEHPVITLKGDKYRFSMTRAGTDLPFSIKLIDFKKEMHPGTVTARAYSSQVIVTDGPAEWPYHIEMNHPLRYKGYTFYQSSFSEREDGEYSILSAVQNKGRVFPYLASAVIFIGLLVHIVMRLQTMKRKKA